MITRRYYNPQLYLELKTGTVQVRTNFKAEDFRELYRGVGPLSLEQRLGELIRDIRKDDALELFGKMVCQDFFDHDNLDAIPLVGAEAYIEHTDQFVVFCQDEALIKQ